MSPHLELVKDKMAAVIRRRRPRNIPAEYIEARLVLPDSVPPHEYVAEMRGFMPDADAREREKKTEELWKETVADRTDLFDAINTFRERFPSEDLEGCSWQKVMEEVNRAMELYKHERFGRLSKPYRCLRKIGASGETFENWLGILPSGTYGSSICAAFKIVLTAAGRANDIRESIYGIVSDIPDIIHSARCYISIYKENQALELIPKTIELYSAVLTVLKNTIYYILENRFKKVITSVGKGERYKADIEDSINHLRKCAARVNDEADICQKESLARVESRIGRLEGKMNEGNKLVQVIQGYLEQFSSHPSLDPHTGLLKQEAKGTTCKNRLKAKRKHAKPLKALPESEITEVLETQDLIDLLLYDPNLITQDLKECRDFVGVASESDKALAFQAVCDPQLREWLIESTNSRGLLINGNKSDPTDVISPLSYFIAELSRTYTSAKRAIVLTYFCSLHTRAWDPRANAAGMMSRLVGQLLLHVDLLFDLSFITKRACRRIESDDFEALCITFLQLIEQLPSDQVVVCLIDNLSIYDNGKRRKDTLKAFSTLKNLSEDQNDQGGPVFKLLVTDPGYSPYSRHMLGRVLDLNWELAEGESVSASDIGDEFELDEGEGM